jgi:hypothetical protein
MGEPGPEFKITWDPGSCLCLVLMTRARFA